MKNQFFLFFYCMLVGTTLNAQLPKGSMGKDQKQNEISLGSNAYLTRMPDKDGKMQNYIKSNGTTERTVLSESQLKMFINTGKMSSLGTVSKFKFDNGAMINFVRNGNTDIFISKSKRGVNIVEMDEYSEIDPTSGNGVVYKKKTGRRPKTMSPEQSSCYSSCFDGWGSCLSVEIEGETITTDEIVNECFKILDECCDRCKGIAKRDDIRIYTIESKDLSKRLGI